MVENSDHSSLGRAYPQSSRAPSVSHDAGLSLRLRFLILVPLALFLVWEVITERGRPILPVPTGHGVIYGLTIPALWTCVPQAQ
jgi:hypothetical protein